MTVLDVKPASGGIFLLVACFCTFIAGDDACQFFPQTMLVLSQVLLRPGQNAIDAFYSMRQIESIEKKPATRELINWIRALNADPDFRAKDLVKGKLPFLGVLFKKSPDYEKAKNIASRRRMF